MATFNFDEVGVYDVLPGGAVRTVRGGTVRFRRVDTDAVVATVPVGSNGRVLYGSNSYGALVLEVPNGLRRTVFAPEALADAANAGVAIAGKVDKSAAPVSVLDPAFGVVGNGVADDTAALNAAFAAAAGGRLDFPRGGGFKALGELTIPSNIAIFANGSTIDFSSMPAGAAIAQRVGLRATGTLGNSILIGAPLTKWSRTVASLASTTGLAAGDLVRIRNMENSAPGGTRTDRSKGELNVIQSVDSATQVTLKTGMLFDYGNDGNLVLAKVTPVKRILINGLTLKMGGVGSAHSGIRVTYGMDVTIRDCSIDGGEDNGVSLSHVYNGAVEGCRVSRSTSPGGSIGNTGYGVAIVEASRHVRVSGNYFEDCRVFVDGGGFFPASFVDVTDNQGTRSSDYGYALHEPCYYWRVAGNTAVDVAGGIQTRGQYTVIENNKVINSASSAIRAYTDDGVNEQHGLVIRDNYLEKCATGVDVDGQSRGGVTVNSIKRDLTIEGNTVRTAQFEAFLVRHFDSATISRNTVKGGASRGFHISGITGTPSVNLAMSGNRVQTTVSDAIRLINVTDVAITGGEINDSSDRGILLDTCSRTIISGVVIRRAATNGVRILNGSQHAVTGVVVTDMTGATSDGVVAVTANDVSITGCQLHGLRYAAYTSGCDYVVIVGNNGRTAGNATKFRTETAPNSQVLGNLGTVTQV